MSCSKWTMVSSVLMRRLSAASLLLLSACASFASQLSVVLEWDPNPEPDLGGYYVYYREHSGNVEGEQTFAASSGPSLQRLDVLLETSVRVSDLKPNTEYVFFVVAYNLAGLLSLPSEEVTHRTGEVANPLRLVVQSSPGSPSLSLRGYGTPGARYEIQTAASLTSGIWLPFGTVLVPQDGVFEMALPVNTDRPAHYYRAVQLP
jgi:hypothetical protein